MYSDMSMRTIESSSPNRNSASVRASSVLPTPDGPRNTNETARRVGPFRPARARRLALGTPPARAVAAGPLGDARARRGLADAALVEPVLHTHQLLRLGLGHLAHRDSGPH